MKGFYIPYKSSTGNILVEKFKNDAFFAVREIEDEKEYLDTFLIYKRKLSDLSKLIADKTKELYNKRVLDLNFVASNLHAFYTKNMYVTIFEIEKHIDVFAWFFSHKEKIKEIVGTDINLKNVENIEKLYELKKLSEEDTKFSDLWFEIIDYLLKQNAKGKQRIIYPENKSPNNLKEAEIILVEIDGQTEEDFNNFRKLITLTNKKKSSKLCIFNNYDTYVNYLNSYYLFVIIFNPKLGFFLTSDKRGLVAHIVAASKQSKEVKEVADYMNDHNVIFLGDMGKIREIEKALAKRLFEDEGDIENYLKNVDKFTEFINNNFEGIVQDKIVDVFNFVSTFIENNININPLNQLNQEKTDRIIKAALTKFFIEEILSDFVKNKTKNSLAKDLVYFLKNIKNFVDEEKYQSIAKNYRSLINAKIAKELKNILENELLKTELINKKGSVFTFKTSLKIPKSNDVIDFNLKIDLNDITPNPLSDIIKIDYPLFVKVFTQTNKLEFEPKKIGKIVENLLKSIDKERVNIEDASIYTKAGFLNLLRDLYSLMFYHKVKEKTASIIQNLKNNDKELKKMIGDVFYLSLIEVAEHPGSENIKTASRNIASALLWKFENPDIIKEIEKSLDVLRSIKKSIYRADLLRKNLTSFYLLKTNKVGRFVLIESCLIFLKNSINLLVSIKNRLNSFLRQSDEEKIFSFEDFYSLVSSTFEALDLLADEETLLREISDEVISVLNKEFSIDEVSVQEIVKEYLTKEIIEQVFLLLYENI